LVSQLIPPWADQIANVIEGRIEATECFFMEGPYSFTVSAQVNGTLEVGLVTPADHEKTFHRILPRDIVESLLAAAELVFGAVNERRLATSDAEALIEAIERLRKLRGIPRLH
jgi:hypothetical protein